MIRRAALAMLGPALGVAGCNSGAYLVVTVSARPAVHDVATLEITQLNNGTSRTDSLELGDHALPATFSISTDHRSGELDLSISGKASDATVVALGAATTTTDAGDATVQLDPTDFVVNTDYAMDQFLTTDFETVGFQLAATSDDKWTAVFRNTCTDTCNVFARTFGADGLPIKTAAAAGTNQYQISATPTTTLAYPAVAAAGTNAIAVWDFTDTVGGGTGIACRGIDSTGALTAGQRTLATDAADTATVTALPTGNFAVSWQVYGPSGVHTILAKPDCTMIGTVPTVVSSTAGSTDGPFRSSIAANGTALLYAWITDDAVRVRPGSTTGALFTLPEATLTPAPAGMVATAVRVAPLGAGFAVAIRYVSTAPGPGQIVLARTSATGLIMGNPVLISDQTGSDFTNGRRGFGIATRADGVTLLVWAQCDDGSADACDGRLDVYGRTVDARGMPLAAAFMIPTTMIGSQTDPSVVALSNAFAVAWTDDSKVAPDTDGTAVRARVIYP
ncbi:MAG: hypothetical protein ABI467_32740 [Kofleriaceae bacterium]